MAFLAKNGMDFSHAFKFGIDFKRIDEEKVKNNVINPLE